MNVRLVCWMTIALAAGHSLSGENLLRDDFQSDGCGGFVGWSQGGFGGAFTPELIDGPNGGRAVRLVAAQVDEKAEIMYSAAGAFMVDTNETVRLSAKVRTRGLGNTRSMFRLYPQPWSRDLVVSLPPDTDGQWVDVVWEGKLSFGGPKGDYYLTVFASDGYPDGAYLDVAEPRFEATLRTDAKSVLPREAKTGSVRPRVTPVDPILNEMSAEEARMRFYYPGPLTDGGERCVLRATLGDKTVQAPFDARHFATAEFGAAAPGKATLKAEVVTEKSGRVLATSVYRAKLNGKVGGVTPLRRLNNFVSEIFRASAAKGPFEFTLEKPSVVFLGLSRACKGVAVSVDGRPVAWHRAGEPTETLRRLSEGRHRVEVTGMTGAEADLVLTARVVKTIVHNGLDKSFKMSKNFTIGCLGPDYFRELGLYRDFSQTAVGWDTAHSADGVKIVAEMEERGVEIIYTGGMGARDSRRLDYDAFLGYVTNHPACKAGKPWNFDENSIGAPIGGITKIHAAEAWWRASDTGCRIDVCFEDGAYRLHANPILDIPELSAYVNSGDGRGLMLAEAYYTSPDTADDVNRVVAFMHRQIRAMRELMPAAPSHYLYLLNGWMMIGGWTTWYNPANDIRALYGEILRVIATDPEFADIGGVAMTKPMCPEDLHRFYAQAIRYYCIDGGTGDFAAANGMRMFPGHLRNGDFAEGLAQWDVRAAEEGSVAVGHRRGYGRNWQGRGYPTWYKPPKGRHLGDEFAVLTRSAKGPNALRQKLTGLEPGRVYQLTFVFCDGETVDKSMSAGLTRRNAKPLRIPHLAAQVSGAEPIHDLDHLQPDFGKYGKDVVFAERLVFRAVTSEAQVIFCDWENAKTSGADIGAKVMLNYVGCHPYFNQGDAELEILKRLFRKAKELE